MVCFLESVPHITISCHICYLSCFLVNSLSNQNPFTSYKRPKCINFCSISVFQSTVSNIKYTFFYHLLCVTFTAAIKPKAPTPTTYTPANHHSLGCCLFIFAFLSICRCLRVVYSNA